MNDKVNYGVIKRAGLCLDFCQGVELPQNPDDCAGGLGEVLEVMAKLSIEHWNSDTGRCVHCDYRATLEQEHTDDCPITKARALLTKYGKLEATDGQ